MKFKIKKDIFLKKSTWLVLGIFAITLINIPRFKTQASGTSDDLNFEPDTIKVLEIMPGNESALGNTRTNPQDVEKTEVNTSNGSQKVEITHMDMAKFISQVDDITGEYDAVAITNGKNNDMPDSYWVDKTYRQFTAPFSQDMGYGKYLSDKNNDNMGSYSLNGSGYTEYYPENDITNKRAQLIVDMINNGQLVYIDSSITSNSKLSSTKLSKTFNDGSLSSKSNFKKVPSTEITLDKLVAEYQKMPQDSKRVKVQSANGPVSEKVNSDGTVTNERTLNFSVNANAEASEQLKFNVYLDFDGDGLFTGDPYFTTTRNGSNGYIPYDFSMAINNGFIGYLGWKVEVVRPNGVKTSFTSHSDYHAQNGAKEIKVLQIYPNKDNWEYYDNRSGKGGTSNTRLTKSQDFLNLLEKSDVSNDYKITVKDIKASDFNSTYGASNSKKHLKDEYDMVIVGFADYYAGADIDNTDALADLDNFIAAGKSVMFTHDTIGLGILGKSNGPKVFGQHYKDIVGQSRYTDVFRSSTDNLYPDTKDHTSDAAQSVTTTKIPHDPSNGKTLGQTAFSINGNANGQNGTRLWERTQTNLVKNINNSQITTYPYDLRNVNSDSNTVKVDLTHTQWYQLNLEDPDIVPWYNISVPTSEATIDSGDSRNFYYTYSKKNITYSGTGHAGVPTSDQELRLFVNTIVKAFRGSNSKPTVTNYTDSDMKNDIENGSTVPGRIKTSEDYTFYTLPVDTDNDKLNVKVEISTDQKKLSDETKVYRTIYTQPGYTGNEPIKVTIPKSELESLGKGATVSVKVTATDPLGEHDFKTFEVVCSGNKPPTVTNYKVSGDKNAIEKGETVNVSRMNNFPFTSILTDPDEEDKGNLTFTVKVDGKEEVAKLSKNGEEVKSGDKFDPADSIDVVVPDSAFEGKNTGDTVTVETTVTDSENNMDTKTFILKIDAEESHTTLAVVDKVNDDGSFVEVANDKKFKNLEIANIAGKVSAVYDPQGVIEISVPQELEVQGDITVKRIVDNKLVDLPKGHNTMTKASDGKTYTFDLAQADVLSLGAATKDGMTFIVQYSAKINDTKKVNDAIDQASSVKSKPVETTVVNADGSSTKTTTWTVTKTWSYQNIFTNTLKFGNNESQADVNLFMSDTTVKDYDKSEEIPIPEKPEIPKNYINVDLF